MCYFCVATNVAICYIISMKQIAIAPAAKKALRKMQAHRSAAIIAKVEAYARGERVDVKKLEGSEFFRIRVGQDRVIIDDQGNIIWIMDAGPRGGIYK